MLVPNVRLSKLQQHWREGSVPLPTLLKVIQTLGEHAEVACIFFIDKEDFSILT